MEGTTEKCPTIMLSACIEQVDNQTQHEKKKHAKLCTDKGKVKLRHFIDSFLKNVM